MRRLAITLCAVALVSGFPAAPPASAQQSLNLYLGGFVPRSKDARGTTVRGVSDDVLVSNLDCTQCFLFDITDFTGATAGGEWLFGIGKWLEGGLGIGLYTKKVPSVYAHFVNDIDGSEIRQDLRLRIVPFSATVRLLPLGHGAPVEPYVGGGVAAFAWRYSETGTFVDFADRNRGLLAGNYIGSGGAAGPLVLGGLRVPIGSFAVGGEIRYQAAEGRLPADQGFAGTRIDLGGFNYLFLVNVRF